MTIQKITIAEALAALNALVLAGTEYPDALDAVTQYGMACKYGALAYAYDEQFSKGA